MMKIYGLVGRKLVHSFSPAYFEKKFKVLGIQAEYRLFEVDDVREVKQIIHDNPELTGVNVTIPFKKDILKIVDRVDPLAEKIGSANTLKIDRVEEEPVVRAYNTDVIGFEKTLLPLLSKKKDLSALVLGTGGAAKAVVYVLEKLQIPFLYVSRNPAKSQLSYSKLTEEIICDRHLIINTTPVGMFPKVNEMPKIPYHYLSPDHVLYDLIYNPKETLFLKKGREKGCVTMNGLRMLELQADAAWEIWNVHELFKRDA